MYQYLNRATNNYFIKSKMSSITFNNSTVGDYEDLLQKAVDISDGDTDEETGMEACLTWIPII